MLYNFLGIKDKKINNKEFQVFKSLVIKINYDKII